MWNKTTNPNLNDLEINYNSIDNLITIAGIDFNNINLENKDEFNIPLKILVNDNKETRTKINCEYVTKHLFDTFYNDYIDFKHCI